MLINIKKGQCDIIKDLILILSNPLIKTQGIDVLFFLIQDITTIDQYLIPIGTLRQIQQGHIDCKQFFLIVLNPKLITVDSILGGFMLNSQFEYIAGPEIELHEALGLYKFKNALKIIRIIPLQVPEKILNRLNPVRNITAAHTQHNTNASLQHIRAPSLSINIRLLLHHLQEPPIVHQGACLVPRLDQTVSQVIVQYIVAGGEADCRPELLDGLLVEALLLEACG